MDSLYKKAEHSFNIGDYDMMLEYSLEASRLGEKGSCSERAMGYLKVGRAYYFLQQKETALAYFGLVNKLPNGCDDSIRSVGYRFTGAILCEMHLPDSANYWLTKAEKDFLNTTRWKDLAYVYALLGENNTDDKKRKQYFDLAHQYAIKSNDTVSIAYTCIKQGAQFLYTDCKTAQSYFERSLALYHSLKMVEGEMYAMKMMAQAASLCGNAAETYMLLTKCAVIHDSIFKAETAEQTAHYQTLYKTEKKERENAALQRGKRKLIGTFIFTILAMGIIFLLIYSRYKFKKQKEADKQIAEQQKIKFAAVVEAEERERKRIAGDLHDGVGQIMSAAKINLSVIQDELQFTSDEQRMTFEKIVALVDDSCREVRSVSHNMMPNALLKSGLANAVRNFINQIDHRVLSVDFYSEGLETALDVNYEVVLYRVIQESVNNVIKHAGASRLYISLIKDDDGISVTIEDNGRGFDQALMNTFEGIGLKNIQSRISYLNGTVEWNSAPGKGTAVIINITAAKTEAC